MKKTRLFTLITAFGLLVSAGPASAAGLVTLDDYLNRVEAQDPEIKSIDLALESMGKKTLELDMVYSPFITGDYTYTDDKSGFNFNSPLVMNGMTADAWNLAAAKKFRTGTSVTFGYGGSAANLDLADPISFGSGTLQKFTAYDIRPFVSLQQSILRDFNGGLTQSGIDKAKAAARAGQYVQLYRRQQLLLKARSAYWGLTLAREVLEFRKTSLDRTGVLLKWNERQVRLDLADRADLLQTQAGYMLRQLNLKLAEEELVKAARSYNEMLGISSTEVSDDLERLSDKLDQYAGIDRLEQRGQRADVLAARESYESSVLADKETYYRSLPELSLTGTYSLHGLDLNFNNAWDQVTKGERPTYSIGLAFTVPLDYGTLKKVRKGYRLDFESAKQALAKAELTSKNDWDQLNLTWDNVRTRLDIARQIKDVQEKRLAAEQKRFERGRTTTFNLLTAENDLDDATLSLYQIIYEELMTHAQSELYQTQPVFK